MGLAVTLYIITTCLLFGLNMIANIFALALTDKKQGFPLSTAIATIFAIIFLVWGISLLVTS